MDIEIDMDMKMEMASPSHGVYTGEPESYISFFGGFAYFLPIGVLLPMVMILLGRFARRSRRSIIFNGNRHLDVLIQCKPQRNFPPVSYLLLFTACRSCRHYSQVSQRC